MGKDDYKQIIWMGTTPLLPMTLRSNRLVDYIGLYNIIYPNNTKGMGKYDEWMGIVDNFNIVATDQVEIDDSWQKYFAKGKKIIIYDGDKWDEYKPPVNIIYDTPKEEEIYLMDDQSIAHKLGFESAEEMEKYYDLCWVEFSEYAINGKMITKAEAERMIKNFGLEYLLKSENREDRLFEVSRILFNYLTEIIKANNSERLEGIYKETIDYLLSEAKKCIQEKKGRER